MTAWAKSTLRRLAGDRAGAMTVELVLVLPLFLLFVLFAFEAGRFLFSRAELSYALHAASRDAMLGESLDQNRLTDRMAQHFTILRRDGLQSLDVAETTNVDNSHWVSITVAYNFRFLLPMLVGREFIVFSSRDRFLRE